jgi:hypothetical protein
VQDRVDVQDDGCCGPPASVILHISVIVHAIGGRLPDSGLRSPRVSADRCGNRHTGAAGRLSVPKHESGRDVAEIVFLCPAS